MRSVRQKLMQEIGRLQRDGELSLDEQHQVAARVQEETDKSVAELDALVDTKQKAGSLS